MEQNRVSYVKKKFAANSVIGIWVVAAAYALLFLDLYLGVKTQGAVELYAAAVGVCSLILGLAGALYGAVSFLEKDKKYLLAKLSIVLGLLLAAGWAGMIIIGWGG